MLELILVVLLIAVLIGAFTGGDRYRSPGIGLGGILLIALLVVLVV